MQPRKILKAKLKSLAEEHLAHDVKDITLDECTPLTWNNYFTTESFVDTATGKFRLLHSGTSGPVCFLIHGAGFSAETWCLFAREILAQNPTRLYAMDMRGHGLSAPGTEFLGKDVLVQDTIKLIEWCLTKEESSEVVLIGHSLGGALATWVAKFETSFQVLAVVVIDVDEEAALDHRAMEEYLLKRPPRFASVEKAIMHSFSHRKLPNLEVDRVSIPNQLRKVTGTESSSEKGGFAWRVDLLATQPYWRDWFLGFSEAFVSLRVPRLLFVSTIESLNRTILIGQMQGLFRVEPIDRCGHTIHEDDPVQVAQSVVNFLRRQNII